MFLRHNTSYRVNATSSTSRKTKATGNAEPTVRSLKTASTSSKLICPSSVNLAGVYPFLNQSFCRISGIVIRCENTHYYKLWNNLCWENVCCSTCIVHSCRYTQSHAYMHRSPCVHTYSHAYTCASTHVHTVSHIHEHLSGEEWDWGFVKRNWDIGGAWSNPP